MKAAAERIESGSWEGACPAELLGLYAQLHQSVYDVPPVDLDKEWVPALSAAKSLMQREFANDPEQVVEFLRWVWRRERAREKRRIAEQKAGWRIGWKFQFRSRDLLTEYRVELARAKKTEGRASSRT